MKPLAPPHNPYLRGGESALAWVMVLLKAHVLFRNWGMERGFDFTSWLEAMRGIFWFEPIPSPLLGGSSYHPPLSFLVARLITHLGFNELKASQISSTLAVLCGFFAVRQSLKWIGWLWTIPGLWVLYGGFSIPVVIYTGVESTSDTWAFAWFMVAFWLSVKLFWFPSSPAWYKDNRRSRLLTWLAFTFAAGLLNKYTGITAFILPFVVILIRRGIRALVGEAKPAIVAIIASLVIVGPFYYQRYYKTTGRFTPAAMDWERKDALIEARAERDAAPVQFIVNMLRYPEDPPREERDPMEESLPHSNWLHLWYLDNGLGDEPEPALTVSGFYSKRFGYPLLIGSVWFLLGLRRIARPWRDFGLLTLTVSLAYIVLAVYFAWKYPLWDWRVFKAKYMLPVVFWIPFAFAAPFAERLAIMAKAHSGWRLLNHAALAVLIVFVCVNHLIPVY